MANNFDLRNFLTENKLTRASKTLNENTTSLNDVITQLRSAIDPANYADMDLGSEQDIIITMLENVQEISRNLLRNFLTENKLTRASKTLVTEDGTYTQKEILRGSMQGFKAPKPEELEVNMMIAPNMAYLDNQDLLNQQMGRITAIDGDKVTYKKGDGKLYTSSVNDILIVGGLAAEGRSMNEATNFAGGKAAAQEFERDSEMGVGLADFIKGMLTHYEKSLGEEAVLYDNSADDIAILDAVGFSHLNGDGEDSSGDMPGFGGTRDALGGLSIR